MKLFWSTYRLSRIFGSYVKNFFVNKTDDEGESNQTYRSISLQMFHKKVIIMGGSGRPLDQKHVEECGNKVAGGTFAPD